MCKWLQDARLGCCSCRKLRGGGADGAVAALQAEYE